MYYSNKIIIDNQYKYNIIGESEKLYFWICLLLESPQFFIKISSLRVALWCFFSFRSLYFLTLNLCRWTFKQFKRFEVQSTFWVMSLTAFIFSKASVLPLCVLNFEPMNLFFFGSRFKRSFCVSHDYVMLFNEQV